jgi:hypothetical protein
MLDDRAAQLDPAPAVQAMITRHDLWFSMLPINVPQENQHHPSIAFQAAG